MAEPSKPNRRDGADTVQPEVRRSRRIFDVAVLVLGMHRTGTSLTASVLEALGVDFGPSETLMSGSEENGGGFWEQEQIIRLDERLLGRLGGTWHAPPTLETGWESASDLEDVYSEGDVLLDELFDRDSALIGFKDPRVSLVTPFWGRLVDIDTAVVCLRHPDEVAASLERRNRIDAEWAAGLWLRYVTSALAGTEGPLVLDYAQWFTNGDEVIDRLADRVGLGDVDMGPARARVRPELRHHEAGARARPPLLALATDLYQRLRKGEAHDVDAWQAVSRGAAGTPGGGDAESAWEQHLDSMTRIQTAALASLRDRERYRASALRMREQRDGLVRERDSLRELLETTRRERETRSRDAAEMRTQLKRARREVATLQVLHDEAVSKRDEQATRLGAVESELLRLRRAASELAAAREQAELGRQRAEVAAKHARSERARTRGAGS